MSTLSYAEQFFLLSVDPVSGRLFPIPDQVSQLTLAGAILLDASFSSTINDDWKQLNVLKTSDSGNPVLDEAIRCLLVLDKSIPVSQAVAVVAAHGTTLSRMVWDSLEKKGMVTSKSQSLLSAAQKQALFSVDLSAVINIQTQIRETVFSDELPEYQIPPLVSLIEAAGLTKYIFKAEEKERFQERIDWLANMESLGREIIRAVRALELSDLEKDVAALIGLGHDQPKTFAGGMDAVFSSFSFLYKEAGLNRSRKLLANFNQPGGFECPACSWPNPDTKRSPFEFCENGAKNISATATTRLVTAGFFEKWSVKDLLLCSDYWLEQQGRLTEPMLLDEGVDHYKPISWEQAYAIIADELNVLNNPDEAVFYASGRSSNEAAFLYQLFARAFGTNNLPNSANICHEPSGKALAMSLGFGKSSITLDDFSKADAIYIFGHNPGSNHPRMLGFLQEAVRNGCKIVAVNPMQETSLKGFAHPKEARSYFNHYTPLSHLYIQPLINGDMALVRGMVKAVLEAEDRTPGILDLEFINAHTSGFEPYRKEVIDTPWELLVEAGGVEKSQMIEAAEIYMRAKNVISFWCLGIAHHLNAVDTMREIVNLMLLRGNVGRPGAGISPVRGHSNVQGIRTFGVGENMPPSFLDALEKSFNIRAPRNPGMSVIPSIQSMAAGKAKVLISLGGNLASAAPDTSYVEQALRRCNLTVMISTKLNRSHLFTGKRALILPCLSRLEEDIRNNKNQAVTTEDTVGKISLSYGCLPSPASGVKSEIAIVAEMAIAALEKNPAIEWRRYADDYQFLRSKIAQTVPVLKDLDKLNKKNQWYYLDNPLKKRIFNTPEGKALFSTHPIDRVVPENGELLLMTIRSHDQFNTSIFGLNDRYRGIVNERRVIFMNSEDMEERNIVPEQTVQITSNYDGRIRKLEGYYAIPYPVRRGCVAVYFPESNDLISINNVSKECHTPAYKSIRVMVRQNSSPI